MNSKEYIRRISTSDSKCNFESDTNNRIKNNMESVRKISSPDFKCNFDTASYRRTSSVSPSTSVLQKPSTHNYKRPNSFPSSSTKDCFEPTGRTKSLSRMILQFETIINDSKNIDNSKISNRMLCVNARNILPLPNKATSKNEVSIPTNFHSHPFSEIKHHSYESATMKENTPTIFANKNTGSLVAHNSNTSLDKEFDNDVKSRIVTLENKDLAVRIVPEHLYEEIDEIDSHCAVQCSESNESNINTDACDAATKKLNEKRIFLENEELVRPVNQRCEGNQRKFDSLDGDKLKADSEEHNIENDEDEIWKNYTERPLLPLKPLQKQKSMSCVNLVQTIKGLSKKKTSSNSRNSSPINNLKTLLFPEHALTHKKEICTSEANISEIRTELFASADLTVRRENDTDLPIKRTRQSLLPNYPWFHSTDAKEASKRLLKMQQNGAFLIRPASNPTREVLHTLCVVFSGKVYNFHVKNLKDGRITLGKRKGQEETFSSLLDMIKFHQTVPISIHSSESHEVSHVYLLITPPK